MTDVRNGHIRQIGVEDTDVVWFCPVCGEPFDPGGWEDRGGYHYPQAGGCSKYGCPTENCIGEIHIYT